MGGALMGFANLVPGISGGTMLLAVGIYPAFVGAVADLSMLRLRPRSILLLAAIGLAAGSVIVMGAGPTRELVLRHRWAMYSLFIGLTLGGVPVVWKLGRPATPSFMGGLLLGLALMAAMALAPAAQGEGQASTLRLLLAGLAGASAMVLPGISGGYLLLLLGQYLPILGAIDSLKENLLLPIGSGAPVVWDRVSAALGIALPVAFGVGVGIVGVSNLIRWTLDRFPKPTFGLLLGLLVGAVLGLWPFQRSVPPNPSAQGQAPVAVESWPVERFTPTWAQVGGSVALILTGLGVTTAASRLGGEERDPQPGRSGRGRV